VIKSEEIQVIIQQSEFFQKTYSIVSPAEELNGEVLQDILV